MGSNSYADNTGKCSCNTGYQLNVSQTECVTIPPITTSPQPTNKKITTPPVVVKNPVIIQQPTTQISNPPTSTTTIENTMESQIQSQATLKPQTKTNNVFVNFWSFIKNIFK